MNAAATSKQKRIDSENGSATEDNYFPISPDTLIPEAVTDFQVYLRRNEKYVLYTKERECFSGSLKERLIENGIHTVYIPYHQQSSYEDYILENLEYILKDDRIPVDVRSRVFLDTTNKQVRQIFDSKLPALNAGMMEEVGHVVESSLSFLSSTEAMGSIGRFVSHDYQTFSHSVHVFSYTMMLMQILAPDQDKESLIAVGIGALLHDIGKTHIPADVLNKPGKLDDQEWEMIKLHPVHGMRMCTNVPLSGTSLNCMVFHHEKYDGSGYPTGMKGEEIPLPVRIITCCDVYDALTSKRSYAPARPPFEALKIMTGEMDGAFDHDVFKAFINVLGKNR